MKQRSSSYLSTFYPESNFGGFSDVDGTVSFYLRVNSLLSSESRVVDFGCGRGAFSNDPVDLRLKLRMLGGGGHHVIGLDREFGSSTNPFLDAFVLSNEIALPIRNDSIDLCLADCVLEHLEQPDLFLAEAKRVLRPGGYLCMRTTNLLGYIGILASVLPNTSHPRFVALGQPGRQEQDVFPTLYRCNTIPKLRSKLTNLGFKHTVYTHNAEPAYLNFSAAAYWLGKQLHKYLPASLGTTIFCFAQKVP